MHNGDASRSTMHHPHWGVTSIWIAIGIVASVFVGFVLFVCAGIPMLAVGGVALLIMEPTPLYGCVGFQRQDGMAYFVDLCDDGQRSLGVFDDGVGVRWGKDERAGLVWAYVYDSMPGPNDERWLLIEACRANSEVREFRSPEALRDFLMQERGLLVDVENSAVRVEEPKLRFR